MNRRPLFVILVIIMMGVAGCSGMAPFGDDTDAETPTDGTETTTAGTQAPNDPTTTTQLSTPKEIDHPPGWNESGVENFFEAYERHYSALYSYDSFTRTKEWTFLEPGQTLTSVGRIDQSSKQLHWNTTVTDSGTRILHEEEYQANDALYLSNRTGTPTYNSTNRYSFDTYMKFMTNKRLARSGPVYYALDSVQYTDSERVVHEGQTMFRYQSTELQNGSKIDVIPPMVSESTVDDFNMTTLVDSDGLIRSTEYEVTYTTSEGETHTKTGMYRLNATDETAVEEPGWVEEAAN